MENEDVVGAAPTGDAPTTSEWSGIWFSTKVQLILETWWYISFVSQDDVTAGTTPIYNLTQLEKDHGLFFPDTPSWRLMSSHRMSKAVFHWMFYLEMKYWEMKRFESHMGHNDCVTQGIPIINVRQSWECLIFIVEIPMLVRLCLNVEAAPRNLPEAMLTWTLSW